MNELPIYEEVDNAKSIIATISQQTRPIFSSMKIYGTSEQPLYVANDIGTLLEIKNIDKLLKNYTPKECIAARIKNVDKPIKLLTRHGMYRIMFDSTSPVSEVFRIFVYTVLDKLLDEGEVKLKSVQSDMQQLYGAELDRATKYLQVRVQNLENEILVASQITRRATELMHNKEHEAGRLYQESQQMKLKMHKLEQQLLSMELNAEKPEDEQLLNYLKDKYLKKCFVYLLPTRDDDEYPYDYNDYNIHNPPDENDTMYYRITKMPILHSQLVKEIYLEDNDSHFIELKSRFPSIDKKTDIILTDLYTITEAAADIRNKPIVEKNRERRTVIEDELIALKKMYEKDI